MYADLQASHAGFAAQLAPVAFSAIAMMELIGALAVLLALRGAGEMLRGAPEPLGQEEKPSWRSKPSTSRPLTLGVELELAIVNTHDYDLTPSAPPTCCG